MTFAADDIERYARHLILKELGGPGQQRLQAASAAIVGLGGLGGPAALYLAGAGVGCVTLIDDDVVELSNLQRQVIFRTEDVGRPKVEAGAEALGRLNPWTKVRSLRRRLTEENAHALLQGHDVILDGTDDFTTRFAVNEAALRAETPLVSGAVGRWDGQIGVFCSAPQAPCYRCFVPQAPPDAEDCAAVGVVGPLTGVIGTMMALETMKVIARSGDALVGRLLLYDGLHGETRVTRLLRDPSCPACGALRSRAVHSAR